MNSLKTVDKSNPSRAIKVCLFDETKRITKPHKHKNYLEIVVFFKAQGQHIIDVDTYNVDNQIAFIIRQDQVHSWNLKESIVGIVILIKNNYLSECQDPSIKSLIQDLSMHQALIPTQKNNLQIIGNILIEAYNENRLNSDYGEGILKAFLADLNEYSTKSLPNKTNNNLYYNDFLEKLKDGDFNSIKVAYYANLIGTTPQNLTLICQKESGKTASQIIADYIIEEAIRRLCYSNNSISEIAFSLGFKDDSHFIKFFKRHLNQTPKRFRLDRKL